MGVEKSVAVCANALSESEQSGVARGNIIEKKTKSMNPERRKPQGINLREGKCRGGMTAPPRVNS